MASLPVRLSLSGLTFIIFLPIAVEILVSLRFSNQAV
jgi:hypothetical protein